MKGSSFISYKVLISSMLMLLFASLISIVFFRHVVTPPKALAAQTCQERVPQDIVLVFDASSSMGYYDGTSTTRLEKAKAAGNYFANRIATLNSTLPAAEKFRVSVVRFADYSYDNTSAPTFEPWPKWSRVTQSLTTDMNSVKTAINNLAWPSNFAFTCIDCGLRQAFRALSNSPPERQQTIILMTDGIANWREATKDLIWDPSDWGDIADWPYRPDHPISEQAAINRVNNNPGPTIHTVGVAQVNSGFLKSITRNGGLYRYTSDGTNLSSIYKELVDLIDVPGAGTVKGTVFYDGNKDGSKNGTDSGVSPWVISITDTATGEAIPVTVKSDGTFSVTGLCDGNYRVEETVKTGWDPTTPISKVITISNGNVVTVNFGNFYGFTLSGKVFIDNDGDGLLGVGDQVYPGNVQLQLDSNPFVTKPSTYTITAVPKGNNRTLTLNMPSGYIAGYPSPASFSMNVQFLPSCSVVQDDKGATCIDGGIKELNFAIRPVGGSSGWIQSEALDARIDKGYVDFPIPAVVACPAAGPYASIKGSSGLTPGVIFSGDKDPKFGSGQASYYVNGSSAPYNWQVGSATFKETFESKKALQLSYDSARSLIIKAGEPIHSLSPYCPNLLSCNLTTLPEGVYEATGHVILNSPLPVNFASGTRVLLINGPVTINQGITVQKGVGAFFMLITSDSIELPSTLGAATPSCTPSSLLDGFYVADHDFEVQGIDNCVTGTDLMLPAAGAVVVNALRTGGDFTVKRTMCGTSAGYPSFTIAPRLDMLLAFPDFLKSQTFIWKEVAP